MSILPVWRTFPMVQSTSPMVQSTSPMVPDHIAIDIDFDIEAQYEDELTTHFSILPLISLFYYSFIINI
jgi:hypothetical protein